MRIAIVGSRNINSDMANMVRSYVEGIYDDNLAWAGHVVLSGGAMGVDEVAEKEAKDRGVPFELFEADWKKYGRSAGPLRNREMIASADSVVAFWDGTSRGTKSAINEALKQQKHLEVFFPDDALEYRE